MNDLFTNRTKAGYLIAITNKQNKENKMSDQDPLATPIGDIELNYPVLKPGPRKFVIKNATTEDNKAQTGKNLVMPVETAEEYMSVKGEVIPKGHRLTFYVSLTPTDKYKVKGGIDKAIGRVLKGAKIPNWQNVSIATVRDNPSMLNDKVIVLDVGYQQASAAYPEGNNIKGVVLE